MGVMLPPHAALSRELSWDPSLIPDLFAQVAPCTTFALV